MKLKPRQYITAFAVLVASLSARAEDFVLGVNRMGLAWASPEISQKVIDEMQSKHIRSLRMAFVQPYSRVMDNIAYANKRGIEVVLVMSLTSKDFSAPSANPRKAQGKFWESARFSQIDLARAKAIWIPQIQQMAARNLRVSAIEIGNEFNNAGFNGDLPIFKGTKIFSRADAEKNIWWPDFVAGMRQLTQFAKLVHESLKASKTLASTKVILGGFAEPDAAWVASSGDTVISSAAVLKMLRDGGIDQSVDAYAVHIYPQISTKDPAKARSAISAYIDSTLRPLVAAGDPAKPWWITEWGFSHAQVPENDASRPFIFCEFLDALNQSSFRQHVSAAFVFDWDESADYRIWDGAKLLGSEKNVFPDENACASIGP